MKIVSAPKVRNLFASLLALMVWASGCLPKHATNGATSTSNTVTNLFSVTGVSTSASSRSPNLDPNGRYYSNDPLFNIVGACRGAVQKILIEITPASSAPYEETVNCSNEKFSWSKTFTTEKLYGIKMSALDSNLLAVSGMAQILKTLVYDATAPNPPTFLTPTTSSTYLITDGSTQVTITGQVTKDVDYVISPTNLPLVLVPNPDLIHLDFSYTVTIPNNSSVVAPFIARDYAGNSSSITMSLQSTIGIAVPIAANELGGSATFPTGLFIHSTLGIFQGVVINDTAHLKTGSSGILGDMQ